MNNKTSFLTIIVLITCFLTQAAVPQKVEKVELVSQIQRLADEAQSQTYDLQSMREKAQAFFVQDSLPTWADIDELLTQLNAVCERAVQMYVLPEDMLIADQLVALKSIVADMKNLMPSHQDLAAFKKRVEDLTQPPAPAIKLEPVVTELVKPEPMIVKPPELVAPKDACLADYRLPKLTDKQFDAGMGVAIGPLTDFYSVDQLEFVTLHAKGNLIDKKWLADYFMRSIFQAYTYELFGYYMKFEDKNGPPFCLWPQKYKPALKSAIEKFKQNKLLISLGAVLMRQKVIIELLSDLTEKTGDNKVQQLLINHNSYADDIQTMIYYFMKEAYEQLRAKIKASRSEQERMQSGEFLETIEPNFIKHPYYKEIVQKLEEFGNPMTIEQMLWIAKKQ